MRNPDPKAWPRCSECKVGYVLRRMITFKTGRNGTPEHARMIIQNEWLWQRDCKHRKAQPEVATKSDKKRSKR